MERIVNGYYDDPKSTRDILGITPTEFELLISCLQEQYNAATKFFELSEDEKVAIAGSLSVFGPEGVVSKKDIVEIVENIFITRYELVYKILSEINQPYPGATYFPPQ